MLISDPSNLKEANRRAYVEIEAALEMIAGRDDEIARLRKLLAAAEWVLESRGRPADNAHAFEALRLAIAQSK